MTSSSLLTLSLSLILLSPTVVHSIDSFCGTDLSVSTFIFQVPVPGSVPSYQYYFNGTNTIYSVNMTAIVFDITGPIQNLTQWTWNWGCKLSFCPTVDYCAFTLNGYSPGNTSLNITIENTVTSFGLKFTVILFGADAKNLLMQNNHVEFIFEFNCVQGSCHQPSGLSALMSVALFSDQSSQDFSIFSILGNSMILSDGNTGICSIDSLGVTTGTCNMTNFVLVLDTQGHVVITGSWNSTTGATALILDPTLTVTGQSSGGRIEMSLLLLMRMILCSFF